MTTSPASFARPVSYTHLDVYKRQAHDRQIHVIGLSDSAQGQGRAYLEELGVDQVIAVSTPPAEIAEMIRAIGPKNAHTEPARRSPVQTPWAPAPARRGSLTAFMPTSGGAGLTEALVGVRCV